MTKDEMLALLAAFKEATAEASNEYALEADRNRQDKAETELRAAIEQVFATPPEPSEREQRYFERCQEELCDLLGVQTGGDYMAMQGRLVDAVRKLRPVEPPVERQRCVHCQSFGASRAIHPDCYRAALTKPLAAEPTPPQTDEKGRPMTYWGGKANEPTREHDYIVQCRCGWKGYVSALKSLPDFKHGCPECSTEFTKIFAAQPVNREAKP